MTNKYNYNILIVPGDWLYKTLKNVCEKINNIWRDNKC